MDKNIFVSLDLGTTKTACVISHVDSKGRLNVLGVGVCPSTGLKRGMIINIEKTVKAIQSAVAKAKQIAGVEVESVIVSIAGDVIQSISSNGIIAISPKGRDIKKVDIIKAIDAAQIVPLPIDREILHVIPQEFIVDDHRRISNPIGMTGVRLEAQVKICTGAVASVQNINNCVTKAGYNVTDLVLDPLASSCSVLEKDERELGILLIDIGGGVTDFVVHCDDSFRYASIIGTSGNDITKEIAGTFRISVEKAEDFKIKYGCAYSPLVKKNEYIPIPRVGGRKEEKVLRSELSTVIESRVKEIFSLIAQEIKKNQFTELIQAGVVLTGGGAMMEGVVELGKEIFKMPVRLGSPSGFGGLVEAAQSPALATSTGLCLYSMSNNKNQWGKEVYGIDKFKKIVSKMKSWISQI